MPFTRIAAPAVLAVAGLLTAATSAGAELLSFPAPANPAAQPFYRWVAPAGVCSATFDLYGAEGYAYNDLYPAGGGAHVITTLAVAPGSAYDIYVGTAGNQTAGGYNGGGAARGDGGGGGGATDLRTGPGLSERILVAGGGGGNGTSPSASQGRGGAAGLIGADGADGGTYYEGRGGGGGSVNAGGSQGRGGPPVEEPSPYWGVAGAFGVGGLGGQAPGASNDGVEGGGGGGGYYGGGGGGAGVPGLGPIGGGGGGGSSLTAGGIVSPTPRTGDGLAVISYTPGSCPAQAPPPQSGGVSSPAAPDRTIPVVGAIGLSRSSFRAASSGASISAKRRAPIGARVSFTLSEASSVRFTVQRKTTGRRAAGKCRRATRANRRKPKCTLWKSVAGSFTVAGKPGANAFTFRGRIGGKALAPGSYRLSATASDAALNVALPRLKTFRIVR